MNLNYATLSLMILACSVLCFIIFLCPLKIEAVQPPIMDRPPATESTRPPIAEGEILKYINTAPAIRDIVANNIDQNDEFKQIRSLGWHDEDLRRFYFLSHYFLYLLYSDEAPPVGQNDFAFQNTLKWKLSPKADEKNLARKYKVELLKAIETIYQSAPFSEKDLLNHLETTKLLTDYYNSFGVSRKGHPPAVTMDMWYADEQIIEIVRKNGLDMIRYKAAHSRLMKAFKQLHPKKVFLEIPFDFIPGPPVTTEEIMFVKKYEQQISKTWETLGQVLSRFAIVY